MTQEASELLKEINGRLLMVQNLSDLENVLYHMTVKTSDAIKLSNNAPYEHYRKPEPSILKNEENDGINASDCPHCGALGCLNQHHLCAPNRALEIPEQHIPEPHEHPHHGC